MFRALLSKEIKLILRDGYALLVLFLMPIVFVLIMSFSLQEVFESENNSVALKIFTTLGDETSAEWGEDLLNLNGFDTEIIKNTQTLIGKAKKQVIKGERFALIEIINNERPLVKIYYSPSAPNYVRSLLELNLNLTLVKLIAKKQKARSGAIGSSDIYTVQKDALIRSDKNNESNVIKTLQKNTKLKLITVHHSGWSQVSLGSFRGWILSSQLTTKIPHYSTKSTNTNKFIRIEKITKNSARKKPSSVQQNVPAWLIFAMFFIIIPFSATLLIELNNGTLGRLNTFPIAKHWILLGKLLPYMLINQIQAILMFLTGVFLMPVLGGEALVLESNFWLLIPISLAISLMAISFALLIAVSVRTHEQASSIGGVSNLLMGAIGGVMVPVFIMPEKMQILAGFSPMNWGLEAFLEILLRQGSFQSISVYIVKLTLLALFLFVISYKLLEKRLLQAS
jgi:ABC-2 type transport system permease protein